MRKLAVGILAHVDAGKTTLSEGMLYRGGSLKKLGRVDHQNAFLDTDALERERGITIFSKQAVLPLEELEITLLDTPGHVDFSGEMERTLGVLDYAILVISGADGVQGHTQTLWSLLSRYQIPTFLFVNKMDLAWADQAALQEELKQRLDSSCLPFGQGNEGENAEEIALLDEAVLTRFLERGTVSDEEIAALVGARKLFPCYFGSALKLEGIDAFLDGLKRFTLCPKDTGEFGAKVFKIARDPQGARLTYLKITGGALRVRAPLTNRGPGMPEDRIWEEKADQIRIYSGAKYQAAEEAAAGTVCAVTGLSKTYPGEGLGREAASAPLVLEPVFTYRVLLPSGCDPHSAMSKLRQLEEEDPQLRLVWDERLRELHIQLMGEVQMEVLKRRVQERFDLEVGFGAGSIVYRETIGEPVEGVGHFEPLRHYAEVHLLLEPLARGEGLRFDTICGEDQLDRSWQRLILTHLEERTHLGVLTGSPITDMKITLAAGRAHVKHTEGGDFRQATYRAVRQGLMCAKTSLLEPWYQFRLELPTASAGRAMSDLQRMFAEVSPPEALGEETVLSGSAPVACLRDYAMEVTAYTRGRGRLFCTLKGYAPCHNQEQVVAAMGYDSLRDTEHTPDSVFCSHGAGFVVKWDHVREYMHVDSGLRLGAAAKASARPDAHQKPPPEIGGLELDKELQAIFERTYGPIKRRDILPPMRPAKEAEAVRPQDRGKEYLLVDGYNVIFDWDDLKEVAKDSLDTARKLLMNLLSNYQGYRDCVVILVFDAYRVPGNPGSVERYHNLFVVYTKEAETADAYIEKTTYEIGKRARVRVATSDSAEQLIILGHGALRVSARLFRQELQAVNQEINAVLEENARRDKSQSMKAAMDLSQKSQQ